MDVMNGNHVEPYENGKENGDDSKAITKFVDKKPTNSVDGIIILKCSEINVDNLMGSPGNGLQINYNKGTGQYNNVVSNAVQEKKCPISRTRLKFIETGDIQDDYLCGKHERNNVICSEKTCLGSIMGVPGRGDTPRDPAEVLKHAKDFLDQYFQSSKRLNSSFHEARWKEVQAEMAAKGTYYLKETELVFAAKMAWRNAPRCIGRIQWQKLQVFDCREVQTTSQMFDALCTHLKYGTNKGNLRSAITVFPQRTDGKHDYRIWNNQLLSYAGYRNPDGSILGDPMHVDFTELCMKLGWKPARTPWDILPLVLSANGKDPDFFEIPKELALEIEFSHPRYEWFKDLKLRWYAMPAVANMRLDCGGIEFTGCAFNGWYMSTEIGCRNICDANRLNMLEKVALRMGLDTNTTVSLWKDRALVEVNIAVLHSFQQLNVTIVDHHTASESFMKHLDNEYKLRSGCPSDWIWVVPPMSGSITPVFHQEMALYYLKPSYEYQVAAAITHVWQKSRDGDRTAVSKKTHRKFHFKQIARAVKFTSKLFGKALSRRIKATILYATETGKSEQFAKQLGIIFGHAFNAQVICMSDYDLSSIEHEALLLVVTSTFGNGDPPENGETFAHNLIEMKNANNEEVEETVSVTPKSFIKANSQADMMDGSVAKLESLRGSSADAGVEEDFGPLSNVRFAVFALGSSAYPNFCEFGKCVDRLLEQLGGERLIPVEPGDELCGQEQVFKKWAGEVFKVACETFCLDDDNTMANVSDAFGTVALSIDTVRFMTPAESMVKKTTLEMLQSARNNVSKKLFKCPVTVVKNLHGEESSRETMFVEFKIAREMVYHPGDHVGILPCNRKEIVDSLLTLMDGVNNPDEPMLLEILKETHTHNGVELTWEPHERLPVCSIRDLFTRFVDITSSPSTSLLSYLATCCTNPEEKAKLQLLATDAGAYEDWKHSGPPTLEETLRQFKSAKPHAALLAAQLNQLQPRFYSISSSPLAHPDVVHITVAVVTYETQDGIIHYGVCSNYLKDLKPGDDAYMFIRSAPSFHLPQDPTVPIILVGPGTGIAPFRGFWHHRRLQMKSSTTGLGDAWLFFGCRTREMDLYSDEKKLMMKEGVLNKTFLALSREKGIPKTYVQGLAEKEGAKIYEMLVLRKGHFYVCGDCTMAEHVLQTVKKIVQKHGSLSEKEADSMMSAMKYEDRYHEDIFGITLRTAEVQNKSRESARSKMSSQP